MNRESVDSYLTDGCGRCDKYRTPQCKVHRWTDTLRALRAVLQDTELVETMKWGAPCYTLDGTNVLMMGAFTSFASVMFFRGALLDDPTERLERPGPNSQAGRRMSFTDAAAVETERAVLLGFVQQAIGHVREGRQVIIDRSLDPMPDELQAALDADPALADAFARLTPGRQRSHILHVSSAKQSRTRVRRVTACIPKIQAGKSFQDR